MVNYVPNRVLACAWNATIQLSSKLSPYRADCVMRSFINADKICNPVCIAWKKVRILKRDPVMDEHIFRKLFAAFFLKYSSCSKKAR